VTEIVFFEKPGCIGNARQKKLLASLGHRLRVKDLLRTPWNAEELRSYFGQLPVPEWEIAPGVHWIGAMDPTLRSFDMILRTANGTTYNAYAVRGSDGVAVVDTVKAEFSDDFFRRLESIAAMTRSASSSSTTWSRTTPARCRS
jgi:hypothetical protein